MPMCLLGFGAIVLGAGSPGRPQVTLGLDKLREKLKSGNAIEVSRISKFGDDD